jgi:hypothetical protein
LCVACFYFLLGRCEDRLLTAGGLIKRRLVFVVKVTTARSWDGIPPAHTLWLRAGGGIFLTPRRRCG